MLLTVTDPPYGIASMRPPVLPSGNYRAGQPVQILVDLASMRPPVLPSGNYR